ncbi:16S rRNA (guanine(966)-N(2))-methyltransferase RsmD [Gordonia sp. ABSL1-1]|uniref:16S rRNA (guanine(966)-N(2))-methyltransferase RsmD n=1 Tax=Gordonia sp. ABSL1-1 TaxID=3053923 RepID=UPI002572E90E|nr:16S rRNA (guanine(966)-N(2))-methyltransferase RsmD [Gordonia sp. ABSL1-1]MDL9939008.1 16S rRNA (guanine(966)-N(2))-methyltransferase RsmD [Gordonia sp. ABSL1-1]
MTRIISGELRGRRLKVPDEGTRPTSDRVREAIFNILDARCEWADLRVLDLYAGSGALGLEALSRGAGTAVLVDASRRAAASIATNIATCGVKAATTVVTRPVQAFLSGTHATYDLVFSDPPYDLGVDEITEDLRLLADGLLSPDALVVLERSARGAGPQWPGGFEVLVDKTYGDTRVEIARHG